MEANWSLVKQLQQTQGVQDLKPPVLGIFPETVYSALKQHPERVFPEPCRAASHVCM